MEDLQIIVKNNQEIITKDWQLQIARARAFWEDLEIKHFKSEREKNDALNFQKEIETKRNYLKDILKSLDNDEISKLRTALLDFDKLLANKNGDIKRAYEYFKETEKKRQVEEGFSLIINQPNFKADYKVYENDYLDAIKGKSYKDYFEISQKVANDYSNILEKNQLKFEKYLQELKEYSNNQGYQNIASQDWLEVLSKGIVLNGISIKTQQDRIKEAYICIREIEEEKLKIIEQIKTAPKIHPIIEDIDTDKMIFENIIKNLELITKLKKEESKQFVDNLIEQIKEFIK